MFYGCSALTELDLSFFDTTQLLEATSSFLGCSSLSNIKFENLNTEHATSLNYMFNSCSSLTSLFLPNLITNHISNQGIRQMFDGCENLKLYLYTEKNINLVSNLPSYIEVFNITSY